ncbi:MAG: PAS domain S-box protein [Burkholderiales bacterium]
MALYEDITARKEAEEALRAANEELDAIFDSSTSGIALVKNRRILRCNRRLEEMFGWGPGELTGRSTRVWYVSDESFESSGERAYAVLSQGRSHGRDLQMMRREGTLFWCRLNGRLIDPADPARGSVWTVDDVTAEHEAAEVLRTANQRLDLAQEASNVGVFDVDIVNGSNYWTPQLERMYGLEPSTFRGTLEHWTSLVHPEDRERASRVFSEALAGDRSVLVDEFRVVRPDGAARWFQSICRIMREPDGGARRAVGVNIDVTELIAARRTAEAATHAKSMFLASMSHEIRTPMNGVMGLLQLLDLSKLDPEQKATVDGARDSARSLLRIIDDLLDFSKIEAGKLEIHPEVASPAAVIENVRLIYSGVASAKDLALSTSVDPGISPALKVDPLRLRQILSNFVSNAIKFTENGGVEIIATLAERANGCDVVRFSVIDTGIGIPGDAQAQLFQPFVQAAVDTARRFGGTGLGLAICRRLADMMEGAIAMQSEVGKGTTMTLTLTLPIADARELPRADPAGDEVAALLASRRHAPGVASARKEGTLVLIAEDHPTNRNLLTRLLGLLGYAAEAAENGREAFEKWKSARYGAILTDCNMPDMDGYELVRAIRAGESGGGSRIPIIACTANALAGEADRCIEAGMDDFVAKPIELAALARAMDRWLPLPGGGKRAAPRAAGSADGSGAPIDRSILAAITGGDTAMEREILADFKAANDADMSALRDALAAGDIAQVTRASHRVKGACKMVGAMALAGVCERMEKAGRRNSWQDVALEQTALERELGRLNAWLSAH